VLRFAAADLPVEWYGAADLPVEWYGEATDAGTPFGHVYLQQPTAQQRALFARYGGGSIPFVDIGNRYFLRQAQYVPPRSPA
jgi:hypothetical protein